jgi:signal transduction histidine kinase
VTASREPAWIADLARAREFPRAAVATAAGLRCAFALPVLGGSRVLGILEFFTERGAEPDVVGLAIMSQIGVQLGRVVERVRAQAELERSNAELAAFAEVASHDLSEPLRSVAGFVALLEQRHGQALDEEGRAFIGHAAEGVRRMQALIDGLLVYARAGADLRPARVAVGEIVAAALEDLESLAAERRAVVQVGELPVVRADARQLQRVLQNLLANAMKFTAPGVVPRIEVAACPVVGAWELTVADNGIGLDPDDADRAFEMLTRLHGGRAFSGSGLGLAISRRVVERHGGRLWVAPRPGGGSVFSLTLPR